MANKETKESIVTAKEKEKQSLVYESVAAEPIIKEGNKNSNVSSNQTEEQKDKVADIFDPS